jgi:hypothetical protein
MSRRLQAGIAGVVAACALGGATLAHAATQTATPTPSATTSATPAPHRQGGDPCQHGSGGGSSVFPGAPAGGGSGAV